MPLITSTIYRRHLSWSLDKDFFFCALTKSCRFLTRFTRLFLPPGTPPSIDRFLITKVNGKFRFLFDLYAPFAQCARHAKVPPFLPRERTVVCSLTSYALLAQQILPNFYQSVTKKSNMLGCGKGANHRKRKVCFCASPLPARMESAVNIGWFSTAHLRKSDE